jgi:predicted outer membrane repeat protein
MGGNRAFRRAALRAGEASSGCARTVPVRRLSRAVAGLSLAGLTVAGSVALAAPAWAAGFVVTSDADSGPGTLREALIAANASTGVLDTITFDPAVTAIDLTSGALEITDPVTITGPGAGLLTIDGGGLDRVLSVTTNSTVQSTVSGVTLTGGGGAYAGGAVNSYDANLWLADVTLTGNTASGYGGAVYGRGGTLTIVDSEISGNNSGEDGGGLYLDSTDATITNTMITGNTNVDDGGGIYASNSTVTITGGSITDNVNSGNDGGGGSFRVSDVTITGTEISGNTAGGDGGGLSFSTSGAVITGSAISGNSSGRSGGGIYDRDGVIAVTGSTISGNGAPSGSAFYSEYYADLTVADSTISGNTGAGPVVTASYYVDLAFDHVTMSANSGSAGLDADLTSTLGVGNSIVAGTTGGPDLGGGGATVTASYSLFGVTADVVDGSDGNLVGVDPQLGALADNGGTTLTMLPATSSPVVDAGDPAYAGGLVTDQRGAVRAQAAKGGAVVTDMGAVELPTGSAVAGGGSGGSGSGTTTGTTTDATTTGTTTVPATETVVTAGSLASTGTDTSLLLPLGGGLVVGGGLLALLGARFRRRPRVEAPSA